MEVPGKEHIPNQPYGFVCLMEGNGIHDGVLGSSSTTTSR